MIRGFSWLQFAAVLCTRAVAYSSPELITRKAQFRLLAARCNRGFQASPATTGALRTMAENLEATAASDADAESFIPTSSPLLLGRWFLDFTDASDVLSLALLPAAEIGDIFQEVKPREGVTDRFVVDNAVELLAVGSGALGALTGVKVAGRYSVEGACKTLSPTRVSLAFVGGRFQPLSSPFSLPAASLSLPDAIASPLQDALAERVYLETTFLDEDMRIARGPGRELYVLSKHEDSE